MKIILLTVLTGVLISCLPSAKDNIPASAASTVTDEISDYYSAPSTELLYSTEIRDSFKIFSSVPHHYSPASSKLYPLILMVDANAYFESVVSELKLGTLTQDFPESIVAGIGYRSFWAMDSLRDRDYTYPKALAEDSFRRSGGAAAFKRFIDLELLPRLKQKYKIDDRRIVLMGHSLGGYFVLYYLMDSIDKNTFGITRFVAASPSLSYYQRYLLVMEDKLRDKGLIKPVKLYSSIGTLEQDSTQKTSDFLDFKTRLKSHHHKNLRFQFDEYSNFNHMDAALPGFMKGIAFVSHE